MRSQASPKAKLRVALSMLAMSAAFAGCGHQDGDGATTRQADPAAARSPTIGRSTGTGGGIESVPLTAPSGDAGQTMFELVAADRTGIDFRHRWEPPPDLVHEIATSMSAGGVAIGDIDGDSLPEVALTRPFGGHRLYRNLGDFRFEDVTEEAGVSGGGAWGTGLSFADVDGDGDLDLFVGVYRGPNQLFVNQSDGERIAFEEKAEAFGLAYTGASVSMAFADYDLDGDLDGYLLTNRVTPAEMPDVKYVRMPDGTLDIAPQFRELFDVLKDDPAGPSRIRAGQYDYLYRNDGNTEDGGPVTFTDVSREAGIYGNHLGLSATWWDYDDDGWPDLYVANDFWGSDQLLRNGGGAGAAGQVKFTDMAKQALPHTPWFSMGSGAADLNNDGRIDYMGADMSGSTHFKRKVGMGDMDENGWFLTYAEPRQYMRNAVYLNAAPDRFMEVAYLLGVADTDWTWSLQFADFDNDGRVDLHVTNGMTRDWVNSDLVARAGDAFGGESWLASPERREANLAYRNLGDLEFESVGEPWGLDQMGISYGSAVGDLDRDGDLDVVVNNFGEAASVYRNHNRDGRRVLLRLVGGRSNRWGAGAKVRLATAAGLQVRELRLAGGFMSTNEPLVHFGLGDVATVDRLSVEWPSGHRQTFAGLDADRLYTVTEPDGDPPARRSPKSEPTLFQRVAGLQGEHSEAEHDDFAHQPLLPNKLSQLGPGLAWGDVDGDDDEDLFVSGAAGDAGRLYLNRGDGEFYWGPSIPQDPASEQMAPLFFDADRDGDLDLYVVAGGVEAEPGAEPFRDRLYANDGRGRFTPAPADALPEDHSSGGVATAADVDRDGDLDLFVGGRVSPRRYPLTPPSRLLRNDGETPGQARFTDATDELAPDLADTGMVTGAVWSDADGDGWIDLLVTHEWGPVKLFHNQQGTLVERSEEAGLAEHLGWWNGIAAGDVDGDGDVDYAVTNFGLNTKYHASPEHPVQLYYGDFGATGEMRLVEAEFEDETLYPMRGKSCSTAAMPHLAQEFSTFEGFASATLQDIYALDRGEKLEATTLESGVLVNDGAGRFTFRALPRLAQASPGFGAVLTEVDGDGKLDLYLVQNFFSPQAETGRMDGGLSLLLMGRGDASFEPVWPHTSGLVVPGDAKSLTTTDLDGDGWVDFVVGQNDGKLLAFENRVSTAAASEGNQILAIRLRGGPGNPTAVGARVTVTLGDGSTQTSEVHAGSGYLSQSSSALHFGLGSHGRARSIDIVWPDGRSSRLDPAQAGLFLMLEPPPS